MIRDWVLGYGIYHSVQDKLRFINRNQANMDVINETESPGSEIYIAQYNLGHEVDEVGVILGIGWNINEHVAIGFSQAFNYHWEEYSQGFTSSVIPQNGSGATLDVVSLNSSFYTKYYKIFAQTKLGIAANYGKWDIGLTFGLPSLGIMGQGEVMSQANISNIRLDPDLNQPRKSYFANARAEKLKTQYKYGWSSALGVSRPIGNIRLYVGVRWYSAVKNYTILDPGNIEFLQPATDSNVLYTPKALRVYAENKAVVNGSAGMDWNYRDNKHLFFSVHSDGHFAVADAAQPGRTLPIKRWDNYHIAIGTQQTFLSSDWMIGVRYSFAKEDNVLQPYSFDDPTEDNFLRGERTRGTLKATAIQLILSYSFRFGAK